MNTLVQSWIKVVALKHKQLKITTAWEKNLQTFLNNLQGGLCMLQKAILYYIILQISHCNGEM